MRSKGLPKTVAAEDGEMGNQSKGKEGLKRSQGTGRARAIQKRVQEVTK